MLHLPYVCVCDVCTAVHGALTHLERVLSALRNVDRNQPHREWCRFKFLRKFINTPPTKTQANTDASQTHLKRHMYVVTYTGQLDSGMCVL